MRERVCVCVCVNQFTEKKKRKESYINVTHTQIHAQTQAFSSPLFSFFLSPLSSLHTQPVVLECVSINLVIADAGHIRHTRGKALDAGHESVTV